VSSLPPLYEAAFATPPQDHRAVARRRVVIFLRALATLAVVFGAGIVLVLVRVVTMGQVYSAAWEVVLGIVLNTVIASGLILRTARPGAAPDSEGGPDVERPGQDDLSGPLS
jgi:hypothetical protein